MKSKKEDKYYVDKKEFYKQMYDWKKEWKKDKGTPLTNAIGKNILNIVKNFSHKKNFINYTYRDKMVTEALFTACRYAHTWDENHPSKNAFSYFTRIAWTSFVKEIKSEHKQSEMKKKLFDDAETGIFYDVHKNNKHDMDNIIFNPEKKELKFQPITVTTKDGKKRTLKTETAYKNYVERQKKKRENDLNLKVIKKKAKRAKK